MQTIRIRRFEKDAAPSPAQQIKMTNTNLKAPQVMNWMLLHSITCL